MHYDCYYSERMTNGTVVKHSLSLDSRILADLLLPFRRTKESMPFHWIFRYPAFSAVVQMRIRPLLAKLKADGVMMKMIAFVAVSALAVFVSSVSVFLLVLSQL